MEDIVIRYISLPATINAFTSHSADDCYNIYVNSNIGYNRQICAIQHEVEHIYNNDFQHNVSIKDCEADYYAKIY